MNLPTRPTDTEILHLYHNALMATRHAKINQKLHYLVLNTDSAFLTATIFAHLEASNTTLARVLIGNDQAISWRQVYPHFAVEMDFAVSATGVTVSEFEDFRQRFKKVRDRMIAHFDKRELEEPWRIWAEANIDSTEFVRMATATEKAMGAALIKASGRSLHANGYEADDVEPILCAAVEAKVLAIKWRETNDPVACGFPRDGRHPYRF